MGVKDTVLNKTEFNRHFKQHAWSLFVCLLLSLLKASLGHGGTSGSPSRLSIQHRVAWPQLSKDSTPLGCFRRGRWTCTMQDTCAASQPSDCYSSSGISESLPQKSEITAQFVHMSSAGGWWMCAVCLVCGKQPKKQLSTGYFDISKCFPPSLIWRVCSVSSAVCSLCTSTSCLRPQSLPVCGDKQVSPLRSSAAFRAVPALQPPARGPGLSACSCQALLTAVTPGLLSSGGAENPRTKASGREDVVVMCSSCCCQSSWHSLPRGLTVRPQERTRCPRATDRHQAAAASPRPTPTSLDGVCLCQAAAGGPVQDTASARGGTPAPQDGQ